MPGETGHVVNPQFIHHLLAVLFDSLNADRKLRRDLLVGAAFSNELQDFCFPRRRTDYLTTREAEVR